MRYIPVEITQDNLSWAINENIRRITEVLSTKVKVEGSVPLLAIDADNHRMSNSIPEDDTDACTLDKFLAIQNGTE